MSFWEAPPIDDAFVATEAGSCRMVERRLIADGEEIVIDGRHQSFVIEHAETDILFFQAVARAGCAPVGVGARLSTLNSRHSTVSMSARVQFVEKLRTALQGGAFVKLTLSEPAALGKLSE